MGFDLAQFLGIKRKRADLGPIMDAPLPPKSLTEFPTGKALNEAILAGLRGEGVGPSQIGFGPQFVSKTTSPLVASRQARFETEELPTLSGELSARGVGRSTIAGREIGRVSARKERDINEIIGQAILLNEQQKKIDEAAKRGEMAGFRGEAAGFAGAEAGLRTGVAGEQARRAGIEVGAQEAADIGTRGDINRLLATAASIGLVPFTGGASLAAIPGAISGGGQPSSVDMNQLLDFLKKGRQEKTSPFLTR